MTPINAIASVPPGAPGLDSGAARGARQTAPETKTESTADASSSERSFWDRLWGKEGFSFGALLDVVNPLQHIPVVATIYRAASGDTIGPAPRVMGGAIFGGVIGLIASAADAVVEGVTGKDTGSHILAMLPEPDPDSPAQWPENESPRHRALMTAVLNLPNDSPTQFAADDAHAHKSPTADAGTAPTPPARDAEKDTEKQAAPNKTAAALATVHNPVAVIPAAAHPNAAPARQAQSGAGGRPVPLANNGRPIVNMPSPKDVAANPALLQELRQGGAAKANAAQQKNTGRIDTAIKGHGLVAPGLAKPEPIATPAAFDAKPNAETRTPDGSASDTQARMKPATASRDPSTIPEVGPDFLMKMQQALEKYQQMRAAPTVDVSH